VVSALFVLAKILTRISERFSRHW